VTRWLALAILLCLVPIPAGAGDEPDAASALDRLVDFTGFRGSLRTGYWSSDRRLDDREHFAVSSLWLKAAPRLGPNAALVVEGWVANEDLFRADATRGKLREAYLDLSLGPVDLQIGKQIIAWGRADRINPTDNLTPRDYTLLFPDDDDQRFGAPAVKATYHLQRGLAVSAIALPVFEPTTIPVSPLPEFLTLRERVPGAPVSQWAFKLEQLGAGFDWSVSYYDGYDLLPDLGVDRVTPTGLDLLFRHRRIRVIGADAATTIGHYGLRAEAAYTFTEDPHGRDPFTKNPFFFMVVGADREIFTDITVNLQYILRVVSAFTRPADQASGALRDIAIQSAVISNQLDAVQHAAAFRIHGRWLNQTLEAETTLIFSFTRLDYAIRPKLTYALTDRWRLTAGADVYRGQFPSLFGRLRPNTGAYAEIRWSF
jgi:hypothetical protein